MRFGTGETNITNLALPTLDEQSAVPEVSPEDFKKILEEIDLNKSDAEYTARLCAAAEILFPDKFYFGLLDSADTIWNSFVDYLRSVRRSCGDFNNSWQNWESYIQFLSVIQIADPKFTQKTFDQDETRLIFPIPEAWQSIQNKVVFCKNEQLWPTVITTAAAIKIVNKHKVKPEFVTDDVWRAGLAILQMYRSGPDHGAFPQIKDVLSLLQDLRILFPERSKQLKLTPLETKSLGNILADIKDKFPLTYFTLLERVAVIEATDIEVGDYGLIVHPPLRSKQTVEKTDPPPQRTF